MSEYTSTQIQKPNDWQAFERANRILFRHVLDDPNLKLYGTSGQGQDGVDLTGLRDQNTAKIVGVQAKKKEDGADLTVAEVNKEYKKALSFRPRLSEYIITTTAKDSAELDSHALKLSQQTPTGWKEPLKVSVWGWGTMEHHISEYPEAMNAFDSTHTAHGDKILQGQEKLAAELDVVKGYVASLVSPQSTTAFVSLESSAEFAPIAKDDDGQLIAEIDRYVDLSKSNPDVALEMLVTLEKEQGDGVSGHIRYKLLASKGLCQHRLGNLEEASKHLIAAYDSDPDNPKAKANKALGLLTASRYDDLRQFAESEISPEFKNSALVAYYLKGLSFQDDGGNPSEYATPDIQKDPEVKHGLICWSMKHGAENDWWQLAHEAADAHPDVMGFQELSASADLESVIGASGLVYGYIPTSTEVETIERAVVKLQKCWSDICEKKGNWRAFGLSIPLNLTTGLRFLNRLPEAKEVVEAALEIFSDSVEMKERAGATFYELDEYDRSRALFDEVGITPTNVMAWMNLYLKSEDWQGLIELFEDHIEYIPEVERNSVEAAFHLAQFQLTPFQEKRNYLSTLRGEFVPDIRGALVLSQGSRLNGFDDEAEYYYNVANKLIEVGGFNQADRITFAREAFEREEYSLTASLLDGHVDTRSDGPDLFMLANSLAHERPFRQRGLSFFKGLPKTIKEIEIYKIIEGQFHVNRGEPKQAVPLFRSAYKSHRNLNTLLGLLSSLSSINDEKALRKILDDTTIDNLEGGSIGRMHLAQILMGQGYDTRAHALGYRALIEGEKNPQIALGYCGLFILLKNRTVNVEFSTKVMEGNWIRLKNDRDEELTGIIGESNDRSWGIALTPANPIIQPAYGKSPGDTFTTPSPLGGEESWTILEIKPRWVQAFNFISNNFTVRYPGVTGMVSFKSSDEDGGLEPTFRQIRRFSEQARATADLHLVQGYPMALASNPSRGGALGFSDYLHQIDENIRTCVGTTPERENAARAISDNQKNGAVIDAFTAWRCSEFGIFGAMVAVLVPLSIPKSEVDILEGLVAPMEADDLTESMSLSYHGGEYFRDVQTVEQQRLMGTARRTLLNNILENCAVENVPLPNFLPPVGEALLSVPTGEAIIPLLYAGKDRLVLSDDMALREIGAAFFETQGVWMQVVLQVAQEQEHISSNAYAKAIVKLAFRRHGHLALNNTVLKDIYDMDDTDLNQFRTVVRFIGGANADRISHIRATREFLRDLRIDPGSYGKALRATNALFASMILREADEQSLEWIAMLMAGLERDDRGKLIEWCRGHFLDVQAAIDLLKDVQSS